MSRRPIAVFGSLFFLVFSQKIELPTLEWKVGTRLNYRIHLESVGESGRRKADYVLELDPVKKEIDKETKKEIDVQTLKIVFAELKLVADEEAAPFQKKFGIARWDSLGRGLLSNVAWSGPAGEFSFPALLFYLPSAVDGRGNWNCEQTLPDGLTIKASGKMNHRRFAASLTGAGTLQDVELKWSATFDPPSHKLLKGELSVVQGKAKATYTLSLSES